MLKYIILIAVDVIVVIGVVAFLMSAKRRRDHGSLRKPASGKWNWNLASEKEKIPKDVTKDNEPPSQPDSRQEAAGVQVCSLCGAPMVIRAAQKGKHAGKPYYGCSNFPKCENTAQYISLQDTKIMQSILH